MAIFLAAFGAFSYGMYQVGQGNKIRRSLPFILSGKILNFPFFSSYSNLDRKLLMGLKTFLAYYGAWS
ncbi:hypothetical protein Gotri_004245 [Gossypium trilobum]|uniref:Uncharacterized protein n=1 Tax=Gossypium trilobum TaxID=34281 RepID=A0A7J9F6A0_9ROSI|nr:hypothetical protein [Gossypium trilobum]